MIKKIRFGIKFTTHSGLIILIDDGKEKILYTENGRVERNFDGGFNGFANDIIEIADGDDNLYAVVKHIKSSLNSF